MKGIVEMVRDSAEPQGRDRFSCSRAVWELLLDIGLACGWRQHGTTYISLSRLKVDTPARHNYQPGDSLDYKRVDGEDAIAWASALDKAKRSAEFASIIKDCWAERRPNGAACPPTVEGVIFDFIAYAYGGEFAFANAAELQPPEEN
jgi:hypothetical protein